MDGFSDVEYWVWSDDGEPSACLGFPDGCQAMACLDARECYHEADPDGLDNVPIEFLEASV